VADELTTHCRWSDSEADMFRAITATDKTLFPVGTTFGEGTNRLSAITPALGWCAHCGRSPRRVVANALERLPLTRTAGAVDDRLEVRQPVPKFGVVVLSDPES